MSLIGFYWIGIVSIAVLIGAENRKSRLQDEIKVFWYTDWKKIVKPSRLCKDLNLVQSLYYRPINAHF